MQHTFPLVTSSVMWMAVLVCKVRGPVLILEVPLARAMRMMSWQNKKYSIDCTCIMHAEAILMALNIKPGHYDQGQGLANETLFVGRENQYPFYDLVCPYLVLQVFIHTPAILQVPHQFLCCCGSCAGGWISCGRLGMVAQNAGSLQHKKQ